MIRRLEAQGVAMRRWALAIGLGGLLVSGCGQRVEQPSAAPSPSKSCPPLDEDPYWNLSDEEIEELCGPIVIPSDAPGVTSHNRGDPDGDSTIEIERFRAPDWTEQSTILDAEDQDNWGVEWPGGTIIVTLSDRAGDYGLVLVRADDFEAITGSDQPAAEDQVIRRELPAGRYAVLVTPGEGFDPDKPYTLSVRRAQA